MVDRCWAAHREARSKRGFRGEVEQPPNITTTNLHSVHHSAMEAAAHESPQSVLLGQEQARDGANYLPAPRPQIKRASAWEKPFERPPKVAAWGMAPTGCSRGSTPTPWCTQASKQQRREQGFVLDSVVVGFCSARGLVNRRDERILRRSGQVSSAATQCMPPLRTQHSQSAGG